MPPLLRRTALLVGVLLAAITAAPAPAAVPGGGYASSLLVASPSDEVAPGATPKDCTPPQAGWAQREEARRGTAGWHVDEAASPFVGYLDRTSARCGDRVGIHLSGQGSVVLTAYRVGWYDGAGARQVWTRRIARSRFQRPAAMDPATRMVEASWPTTATVTVTSDWVPGVYLVEARSVSADGPVGQGAVMPLVVENPGQSPLLAVASTLTWAAYNPYGGESLYAGPHGSDDRALVASLDRPLVGTGLSHLLVYDLPLARFFGRLGVDVDWTTDDALDARPSQLDGHAALALPGHSEYWTARMYDAVEAARSKGLNIAFLGADPVYWQARLEPSPLGNRRHVAVYRTVLGDPMALMTPDQTTVRWRDAPLQRDEAQLAGVTYSRSGVHAGMQVAAAPDWMLAGTGLGAGGSLPGAAANEVDQLASLQSDAPPNLQIALQGSVADASGALSSFASTYYTTPQGAGVFAAGTTAWPCDLEDSCPWGPVPESTSAAVRVITANVLRAFTTPGFTAAHSSAPSPQLSAQQVWDGLPASLRGTAGPRTVGGLDDD